MTIENDNTHAISNTKLLADIENTRIEKEAYEKLASGYETLAGLPENRASGQANVFAMKSRNNSMLAEECGDFLTKLTALKAERGIDVAP